MKSATQEVGVKPLKRLAASDRETFKKEAHKLKAKKLTLEAKISGAREKIKRLSTKGDETKIPNEEEILANLMAEQEESNDTEKRIFTSDSTIEKFGMLLNENQNGLLLLRDELSGWLRSLDKSGREGDREFWLECWNGTSDYTVDRIGRGTLYIPAVIVSVLGGIQPGKLSTYLTQTMQGGAGDDGLLQRFQLLVYPEPSSEWQNIDRFPDRDARTKAFAIFQWLHDATPESLHANEDDTLSIPFLRFDEDAQALFDEWRTRLELRLRSGEIDAPSFASHLAKYRSLMPSLALLFYLIDLADGEAQPGPVTLGSAKMAADWCDFLELHALKIYAGAMAPSMQAAHTLAGKVKRGGVQDGVTLRELQKKGWAGLSSYSDLKSAIAVLEDHGWLRVETIQSGVAGGRPKEIIKINPSIQNGDKA